MGVASRRFAYALYGHLAADAGTQDVVLCPWSLVPALTMTYGGARGATAEQLHRALGLLTEPHAVMSEALLRLGRYDGERGPRLFTVNGTWLRPGAGVREDYLDLLGRRYGAELYELELVGAEGVVNEWYARVTRGELSDVVPAGTFTPDTALVLTTGVLFAAAWAVPFPEANTHPGSFELLDGSAAAVPFMSHRARYHVAEGDGWQAVRLAYTDDRLAMYLVLPERGAFARVEEAIATQSLFDRVRREVRPDHPEVIVTLPRFEARFEADLIAALRRLGVVDLFERERADLSGMLTAPAWVGAIRQEARVRVDESGTVASAGTTVVVDVISLPPVLVFDRPFFFAILEEPTEQLLFLGRVADPR